MIMNHLTFIFYDFFELFSEFNLKYGLLQIFSWKVDAVKIVDTIMQKFDD